MYDLDFVSGSNTYTLLENSIKEAYFQYYIAFPFFQEFVGGLISLIMAVASNNKAIL